ncbi:MAG: penicillin-binding protein activator [Nitrospira sp.]|jgi:ABC-type branched-subunit amino acid transport system substrate-binding protein|nr:penicillin-binding protein activator [Nitrospira sp.]HRA98358.1 penicillin-binding protein activator [Nitrospira sp.]
MVPRSVPRSPHYRACTVALAVAFLAGLVTLGEAAPPPKNPAPSRSGQAKTTTTTGQASLDQVKRLIDAEQPEAAAVMLRRFMESGPAPDLLDDAYLLMAAAMFGMKEHTETIRYVNQLLGEFPNSDLADRAKLLLAKTHARAGNLDLALPLLSEVRSLSVDSAIKRDALRLTGEFQAQKKDYLRAIHAWLEEIPLDVGDQAHETETHIRQLVNEQLDVPTLVRVREAYPRTFPGDLASIKLIDLHTAAGEDHLVERDLRLFLSRFPNHAYAAKAAELQAVVRTKFKAHPYSIAAIFPMSGKLAPFGTEVLNGIQLALERSKDGGETPSIGLIVKDTESDRAAFLDELSDVLSDDRPLAVIGPLLSKNLPVMAEMAERTRIPLITPSATTPNLRRFGSYVFSTALTYGHQAKRVADYASREQHYKRIAILYPDSAYGRDLTRLFTQEIRQQDGEIIASESYKEGDTDFRAVIARLKAEDLKKYGVEVLIENDPTKAPVKAVGKKNKRLLYSPGFDAVFIPGRSLDVGLLAAQLAFFDITVPLLGTNGWNTPDFARVADRSVEGSVFVDGFFSDSASPVVQEFVERYRKRFQATPSLFAAQGYDAARLAVEAIKRGATTGEGVRDYLMMQHDLPSLSGPSGFSADGTLNRHVFLIQVKQGKFVPLE